MPKFFLTTPSYRTYADPHLGTAYPVVVADAVARYQRMKGMEVMFATSVQECPQRIAGTPADRRARRPLSFTSYGMRERRKE